MKTIEKHLFRLLFSCGVVISIVACSGLPETNLVTPDNNQAHVSGAYIDIDVDKDYDHPIGTGGDGILRAIDVEISVNICDIGRDRNAKTLTAYNPTSFNSWLYANSRYAVKWKDADGNLLSETIHLECVDQGTYTVQVFDSETLAIGESSLTL